MAVYNGIDVETRERIYSGDPEQYESDRAFGREVGRSAIYQKYADEFERDPERDYPLILEKARELNHDPEHTTVSMFLHSLETLMLRAPAADRWTPGKLKRKAPEPVPIAEPEPVHRGQELWRSHAEFMKHGGTNGGEPTMDEVRAHARESASFRAYVQQAYRKEMSGEIGGAGVVLNARVESDKKPSQELLEWVERYRRTPVQETRNRMRADINPGGFEYENRMFTKACEHGLI